VLRDIKPRMSVFNSMSDRRTDLLSLELEALPFSRALYSLGAMQLGCNSQWPC
jgi:hypothetical protein